MKTQYPYRRQTISNQQTPGYRSERSERKNLGKNESGIILNESTQYINGSTHSLHGSSTIPKLIISLVISQLHEKHLQISQNSHCSQDSQSSPRSHSSPRKLRAPRGFACLSPLCESLSPSLQNNSWIICGNLWRHPCPRLCKPYVLMSKIPVPAEPP